MTMKNVFLGLLLLSSILLWQWYDNDGEILNTSIPDLSQPDFIASNIYSVSFDDKGELAYRIYADSMEHHEIDKKTTFTKPIVLVYPAKIRPIWQLSANNGVLYGGDEAEHVDNAEDKDNNLDMSQVILNDNVKITNLTNNEYVKQITTSEITLDLETQTIHTQEKVFIAGPLYDLEGLGLLGNLKNEQVSLLNKVHGIYHAQ